MKNAIQLIENFVNESVRTKTEFFGSNGKRIVEAADAIVHAFRQGRKVLLFGNGGSAADAQHIAAEFVGRFIPERPALPAISLSTDTSILTACGKVLGF